MHSLLTVRVFVYTGMYATIRFAYLTRVGKGATGRGNRLRLEYHTST
jgi:hypothetical protein